MPFSNNPQAVYNGMLSGQRQMFLSSSVAIAMIGFSHNFKKKHIIWLIKLLGVSVLILSIFIGIKTANDFKFYLNNVNGQLPNYVPLEQWRNWMYINYIYSFFVAIIGMLFFFREVI